MNIPLTDDLVVFLNEIAPARRRELIKILSEATTFGSPSQVAKPEASTTTLTRETVSSVISSLASVLGKELEALDTHMNTLMKSRENLQLLYNNVVAGVNGPSAVAASDLTPQKTAPDSDTRGDNAAFIYMNQRWYPDCEHLKEPTINAGIPTCEICGSHWESERAGSQVNEDYMPNRAMVARTLRERIPGIPDETVKNCLIDLFPHLFPSEARRVVRDSPQA